MLGRHACLGVDLSARDGSIKSLALCGRKVERGPMPGPCATHDQALLSTNRCEGSSRAHFFDARFAVSDLLIDHHRVGLRTVALHRFELGQGIVFLLLLSKRGDLLGFVGVPEEAARPSEKGLMVFGDEKPIRTAPFLEGFPHLFRVLAVNVLL